MELVQTGNGKHGRALPREQRLGVFLLAMSMLLCYSAGCCIYLDFGDEFEVLDVHVDLIACAQIMWVLPVRRLDLLQPLRVPFRVGGEVEELGVLARESGMVW